MKEAENWIMVISEIRAKIRRKFISAAYKFARKVSGYRIQPQNIHNDMNPDYPEIYNEYGEKLNVFYLADMDYSDLPYSITWSYRRTPRCIYWDRYNRGLKTHFYTVQEAFKTVGNPDRRFYVFNESRVIRQKFHRLVLKHRKYIENEFDLIFTCDEEILNTFSNARFVPFDANYWYGENDSSIISADNYLRKDKGISIIASNKTLCPMHFIRQDTARKCLQNGLADTFGKFAGVGGGMV